MFSVVGFRVDWKPVVKLDARNWRARPGRIRPPLKPPSFIVLFRKIAELIFDQYFSKNMCKLFGIEKSKTTPWHPQTNGFRERSHKTSKAYLRSFVDKDSNWDRLLCYATFCYNTTVHTSTNFTPYELAFGRTPGSPTVFLRDPEPQYNYEDYVLDPKRFMQETRKTAQDNLIKKKETN